MTIAIASGKGGTGKTMVAVNLAWVLGSEMQLLDCDVEEPNGGLFLAGTPEEEPIFCIRIPEVDEDKCNACGDCARFCEFNAIVSLGARPLVFPEMCHGCGECAMVCPERAIREIDHRSGSWRRADRAPSR